MLKHLKKLLPRPAPDPQRYEREKRIARSDDLQGRLTLAENTHTHKEILYYLATHDPADEVRRAVALNTATPVQASSILAADSSMDVRLALAERLVKLLPDLDPDRHSQLYAFAVQALGMLALDEVLKIRKALASALKDHAHAPPKVAGQLAKDIERAVSEPILKFCTSVPDEDLIEILKAHPESWTVQAIAGRKSVSRKVSRAVIDTGDRPSGKILLDNKGATIDEETLTIIVEKAREYPEWQVPLAQFGQLPPSMARKLAAFADRTARDILSRRTDLDKETAAHIMETFHRRLDYADNQARARSLAPADRVRQYDKEGRLHEQTLADALAMRDFEFTLAALAYMAGTDLATVERIFGLKTAKPIIALCWKAGLSMRFALQMQKEPGHVQPRELIYPREGTDYPLTEDELLWQLEFLGVEAA